MNSLRATSTLLELLLHLVEGRGELADLVLRGHAAAAPRSGPRATDARRPLEPAHAPAEPRRDQEPADQGDQERDAPSRSARGRARTPRSSARPRSRASRTRRRARLPGLVMRLGDHRRSARRGRSPYARGTCRLMSARVARGPSSNGTGSAPSRRPGRSPGCGPWTRCRCQSRTVTRASVASSAARDQVGELLARSARARPPSAARARGASSGASSRRFVEPLLLQVLLELRHDAEPDHRERGRGDQRRRRTRSCSEASAA